MESFSAIGFYEHRRESWRDITMGRGQNPGHHLILTKGCHGQDGLHDADSFF